MGRYLSHEAATALNVYLFGGSGGDVVSDLVGGIENGLGESVVCALGPDGWLVGPPATTSSDEPESESAPQPGERRILNAVAGKDQDEGGWAGVRGDVEVCVGGCGDEALRRVGGAAVGLGLVQRAEVGFLFSWFYAGEANWSRRERFCTRVYVF